MTLFRTNSTKKKYMCYPDIIQFWQGGEVANRITFARIRHVFTSIAIQNLGSITLPFHSQDVLGF